MLHFSKMIAGTMTWGAWGKKLNTSQMIEMIEHCISHNITTFDHADIYGDYTTEADFGKAFISSGIDRDGIQLISKCGIQLISNHRPNKVKHYNYSKEYIIQSAEQSLSNLQTDYLDLFLLHRPSPLMTIEPVVEAITQLKQQGKIKSFGVSNFSVSQMQMFEEHLEISTNQIECSLTQPSAMFDGVLDHALMRQQTVMAWSPLGSYFKQKNQQTARISQQLEILKPKYQATEDQLLLAWLLKHPTHMHPVIGTGNFERILQSAKSLEIDMDLEDWFMLLEASNGYETP